MFCSCRGVSTFWISHPNNTLINNAAAGSEVSNRLVSHYVSLPILLTCLSVCDVSASQSVKLPISQPNRQSVFQTSNHALCQSVNQSVSQTEYSLLDCLSDSVSCLQPVLVSSDVYIPVPLLITKYLFVNCSVSCSLLFRIPI